MKKIKLMLVAIMAMVGVSAFAVETPWATTTYKYTVDGKIVTITGFVTGYATESMATVTIPNELPNPKDETKSVEVTGISSKAFAKNANIKKVIIKATKLAELNDAFSGCANLEEIDFTEATGLKTIAAGAFTGTKIKALDLSTTILTGAANWFGTKFSESGTYDATTAAEYNAKLDGAVSTKSIKTPATTIASDELDTYYPEITTAWTLVAKDAEDLGANKLSVVKYNAVTGAELEAGDALTEKRVAAYNDNRGDMVGTSKGDEVYYTEGEAVAYNAKLKGAVKAGDEFTNPAVTNTTLASVKLPGTWLTIAEKAFVHCSALTSIDFGTVKVTGQTISQYAFVGTGITELDFSNTLVNTLPNNLLIDGTEVETNATLTKVTLTKNITDLKGNFANCTALTAIDLTNVTTLNEGEFAGSGLTSVTIPAAIATISASAFENCEALATVTFAHKAGDTFTEIKSSAFANTAITKITIPAVLPITTASKVAENAFADCAKLKEFTYKPSAEGAPVAVVDKGAFLGCNDGITFYTTAAYKTANATAPMHTTYSVETAPSGGEEEEETTAFTAVQYKQSGATGKYFYKWKADKNVKIAKTDAKVYAAYVDAMDGTLNMMCFRARNSFYHIAAGDIVLITSTKESIPYRTDEVYNGSVLSTKGEILTWKNGSSFLDNATEAGAADPNSLKYIDNKDGVKRSVLEGELAPGYYIFAWVNTDKGTGFQKITSGTSFPYNTLYLFAKPEPTAAAARVIWYDENGNIEEETTAIQGIQDATAENGAIYNLAGQKVNASYKGVVVKNGKKYIK